MPITNSFIVISDNDIWVKFDCNISLWSTLFRTLYHNTSYDFYPLPNGIHQCIPAFLKNIVVCVSLENFHHRKLLSHCISYVIWRTIQHFWENLASEIRLQWIYQIKWNVYMYLIFLSIISLFVYALSKMSSKHKIMMKWIFHLF